VFACVACSRSHGQNYAGEGAQPAYISRSEGWRRAKKHENHVCRENAPQEVEESRGSGCGSGRGSANGSLKTTKYLVIFNHRIKKHHHHFFRESSFELRLLCILPLFIAKFQLSLTSESYKTGDVEKS
jgi:hypothetical protein